MNESLEETIVKEVETVKKSTEEGAEPVDKTLLLPRSPVKEVEENAVKYEAMESSKQCC